MQYGADWKFAGDRDIMIDELGHRRHADNVPCFLGGRLHSYRHLGQDIRHCVLREIFVCVYDGHEKSTRHKPEGRES